MRLNMLHMHTFGVRGAMPLALVAHSGARSLVTPPQCDSSHNIQSLSNLRTLFAGCCRCVPSGMQSVGNLSPSLCANLFTTTSPQSQGTARSESLSIFFKPTLLI